MSQGVPCISDQSVPCMHNYHNNLTILLFLPLLMTIMRLLCSSLTVKLGHSGNCSKSLACLTLQLLTIVRRVIGKRNGERCRVVLLRSAKLIKIKYLKLFCGEITISSDCQGPDHPPQQQPTHQPDNRVHSE